MRSSVQALLASSLLLAGAATAAPAAHKPAHKNGHKASRGDTCPDVDAGFDVQKVMDRATSLSSHSWEYGTAAEALLELSNSEFSVFSSSAFPDGKLPNPDPSIASLSYAKPNIRTDSQTLVDGDGASGDPAALGVSALLIGQSDGAYFDASERQKTHLLEQVPRMSNDAISQRDENLAAWADFMYMAPPFLAYYAVATNDVSLLQETVRQCGLYKDLLQVDGSNWQHILVEDDSGGADAGLWSTGNAWAAAGMARVLATLTNWENGSSSCSSERDQLVSWIKEILDGAKTRSLDDGLLRNYLDDDSWFGENSGTALLAAVAYRVAVLAPETFGEDYISWADSLRQAVASHVGEDGTISPNVNPLGWGDREPYTSGSPEGQSFAVLMYTGYRDCVCAGKCQ
ncbi:hypothetical protein FH972_022344 [Carpinus fangiana]|uniref:Six-hairpin glycosidase-like protein n=1 Tax=Carpinus fangiana TaxID=176857 RepID=A0A5N6KSN2_9ROSI|nr:hypothetical protein FH972_022344 [Carpinus fangiana]